MPREFFDHTGDVGVRLTADSEAELFREAALAFTETLTDLGAVLAVAEDEVEVTAPSLDDLMTGWLDELLYRFEVRSMLVADVDVAVRGVQGLWRLDGVIRGEPFDESRHAVKVLIKGVTYHQLDIRCVDGQWRTNLVFDI